jgi:outer membrane protein TolC
MIKRRRRNINYLMKNISIILFCFLFSCINIYAQEKKILPLENFIAKVKTHHPLARVANIQLDKANANLLMAKGGFDPSVSVDLSSKIFDSKNYYNYNQAELKVPLPIGEVKTGIENNGGQFLESEISKGRSSYLGVEIPLVKGLMIDKRRAFLQQAKIAVQQNTAQQKLLLNDLLLEAYVAYYHWVGATKLYNVFSNYVAVSNNRLRLVKTGVVNGDRPAMDSIEAISQLQNFELMQADAFVKITSATLDLNNFIWDGNGLAQNITTDVVPDTTIFVKNNLLQQINVLAQSNSLQNPLLQQYKFKIDGLQIEKKLKYQNLLPTLNFKANLLNSNYFVTKNLGTSLLENNNRWGLNLKIPLRFREGRGEYKLAKLKIEESSLELKQKTQEIENKIKDYTNQFLFLQKQIVIANETYNNYNSLLRNETLRFSNGESSLFLVNSRENKMLEMEQKRIELQVKLIKVKYTLDWANGSIK